MIRYEAGDVINGTLELIRPLGKGGFGSVFAVRDLIDDQLAALKLLDPARTDGLAQLQREVGPLRRWNHPNIVKVRSQGKTDDGVWYIEMELVQGETLGERVARTGPLLGSDLLDLGAQLLEALVYIHPDEERLTELARSTGISLAEYWLREELRSSGLVHRDVKPSNLVIENSGRVVLVDFGISSTSGASVSTVSYTPGYSLGEALPGLSQWDPEVDRYAAAATLRFAATGQEPGADMEHGLGSLEGPVGEFLRTGLHLDGAEGFRTTREMLESWLRITRNEPGGAALRPAEFLSWHREQPHDGIRSEGDVVELLMAVIAHEQPILCSRLYRLAREVDPDLSNSRLNKIVYRLVSESNSGLAQVEPLGGGQQNKTVYIDGSNPSVLRTLGDRPIDELPPVELEVHVAWARRTLGFAEVDEGDERQIAEAVSLTLAPDADPSELRRIGEEITSRLAR